MDTKSGSANGNADAADPRRQASRAFDAFSGAAAKFIDANQRYLLDLQEHSREAGARILAAAGQVRTIRPGDAVTMDFRPDRLNLEIGEDGRITRFRCG